MPEASLISKLAEACDSVGGVEKKGRNQEQRYTYVRAADIAKAIRHELFSRGIVILQHESPPEYVTFETKSGSKMLECRLEIEYTITNGPESLKMTAYGVGRDSGDKSIWKAKTGALKYFLRGLGLIPDEKDDPEHDSEAPSDEEAGEMHSGTRDNTLTLAGIVTDEKETDKGIWYTIHTLTAEGEADAHVLSTVDSGRLADRKEHLVSLRVRPLVTSKPGLFFTLVDVLSVRKPEKPAEAPPQPQTPATEAAEAIESGLEDVPDSPKRVEGLYYQEVTVKDVERRNLKAPKKGQYILLTCRVQGSDQDLPVSVWDTKLHEYALGSKGKVCEFGLKRKESGDRTYYSLETIEHIGGSNFIDSVPVDGPTGEDLFA